MFAFVKAFVDMVPKHGNRLAGGLIPICMSFSVDIYILAEATKVNAVCTILHSPSLLTSSSLLFPSTRSTRFPKARYYTVPKVLSDSFRFQPIGPDVLGIVEHGSVWVELRVSNVEVEVVKSA